MVEDLSGGRIGYIYVPNTSFAGFSEFYKGLQSLNHKDGLIIDERYNGGGFAIPQFAYVNTEGEWDVEYYGVKPDIEVFDEPGLIQAGRQPMIEKAVE